MDVRVYISVAKQFLVMTSAALWVGSPDGGFTWFREVNWRGENNTKDRIQGTHSTANTSNVQKWHSPKHILGSSHFLWMTIKVVVDQEMTGREDRAATHSKYLPDQVITLMEETFFCLHSVVSVVPCLRLIYFAADMTCISVIPWICVSWRFIHLYLMKWNQIYVVFMLW